MLFMERLELYISAGLSLDKALSVVEQGMSSGRRVQVQKIHDDITGGSTLSVSLASVIGVPPLFVGIIRQGEGTGGLASSLAMARRLMEQQDDIKKKILSALAYPAIIGTFALLLTIGLVKGIMPQIIPMLKGLNVELPLLTRIVMAISENITTYGVYGCLGVILAFGTATVLYKKFYRFRKGVHRSLAYIPLVGSLSRTLALSVFFRSCGSLIDSGISAVAAYAQAAAAIPLIQLAEAIQAEGMRVAKGLPLGSVIGHVSVKIPSYIPPLLLAGEASGTLGASLVRAADIIDRDIDHSLKRLTALIEPTMMAGMGGVVGAIALSIMMPIYDISRALQH